MSLYIFFCSLLWFYIFVCIFFLFFCFLFLSGCVDHAECGYHKRRWHLMCMTTIRCTWKINIPHDDLDISWLIVIVGGMWLIVALDVVAVVMTEEELMADWRHNEDAVIGIGGGKNDCVKTLFRSMVRSSTSADLTKTLLICSKMTQSYTERAVFDRSNGST